MPLMIDANELVGVLRETLDEDREKAKAIGSHPVANAYMNAHIDVCTRLLIVLDKSIRQGEVDMAKLTLEFKKETVSLDELLQHRREGVIEPKILEVAKTIPRGQGKPVEHGSISWGHFSSRVYNMVERGTLKETYAGEWGPLKRGEEFLLAHYTKEQAERRHRRTQKVKV